jgi:hypothetical protein
MLGVALIVPVAAPVVLRAQDDHDRRSDDRDHRGPEDRDRHAYEDRDHHDRHEWNSREDRAYRIWAREQHRKHEDFNRLNERDQANYWNWRHNHSDAQLRIDIR